MKKFAFKGISSGDYESFCFDVPREDYIKITGTEPRKHDESIFFEDRYRIYPSDLLKGFRLDDETEYEFNIQIEVK